MPQRFVCLFVLFLGVAGMASPSGVAAQEAKLDPATMPPIGTVDVRFLSYNVEMVEVIGGRFWKPYGASAGNAKDPYQYRPPIDLSNARLRKLAAALGPAYMRVSGTWANSVYFHDADSPPPPKAPQGFNGVLTRAQWKGVIDFARAVNAQIVTSFSTSPGARDRNGVWQPEQARQLLQYTRSLGGRIAAAEFMNEPTYAGLGGAPKGYDAAAYGRDIAVFAPFFRQAAPDAMFLGPGSVGEGPYAMAIGGNVLSTESLLKATGPAFDAFSYHLYAAASQRCAPLGIKVQTTARDALSEEWLTRPLKIHAFYAGERDRFEPGKPIWITETAQAACGGDPWASTFLDSFRYLIEHGELARRGVQTVMHNTLASSDYGLLDDKTFAPRPNYWAALLWKRLMGATVLDPGATTASNVFIYAHCMAGRPGAVAVLVVNADRQRAYAVTSTMRAASYTLSASEPQAKSARLNGKDLTLGAGDELPPLPAGDNGDALRVAPTSIAFLGYAEAGNPACR